MWRMAFDSLFVITVAAVLCVGLWVMTVYGLMVMTPEVALESPAPLAVRVVVPTATPVRAVLLEEVLPAGMVVVDGTVATPGALLVRLTLIALAAA